MSTFVEMFAGFTSLAVKLTGLQVEQQNSPQKYIDPKKKGHLEFRVIACRPLNSNADEWIYSDDGTLLSMVLRRQMVVQVKFEGYDQGYGMNALFYLERLGNRLTWPSSLATLDGLDMGLVTRGGFFDLSRVLSAEDRQWSVGAKDFTFTTLTIEPAGTDDNPSTWVETLIFNSHYIDDSTDPQITGTVTRP